VHLLWAIIMFDKLTIIKYHWLYPIFMDQIIILNYVCLKQHCSIIAAYKNKVNYSSTCYVHVISSY